MKTIHILFLSLILAFTVSCSSVRVNQDYDKNIDFNQYKTYAYFKNGIDKVEISDLDKKRILNSLDKILTAKGLTKSENPDILINFSTKERENINVNQYGYGWGFGWNPWFYGNRTSVQRQSEGVLTIDFIDNRKKELIWQGYGEGTLTKNVNRKDEVIQEFVDKILEQYPPKSK
jgi:hypothetical protein